MAKAAIRKGSTKTITDPALNVPTDRPMKVAAYDDDMVIVEWTTETEVWGQKDLQPITRTARLDRKVWDNA